MMPVDWRPPTLSTKRLFLRAFRESDAKPLFAFASNPNVAKFTLWNAHRNLDDTLLFLRDYALSRYREGMPEPYALTLRDDPTDRPLGAIGCFWSSQPNYTMELGYWLAEPYWGQGFVGEAVGTLLQYVRSAYEVERVQARVIEGNTASVRVLEKCGFRYEGTHRSLVFRRGRFENVLMFAKLRNDP